MGRSRNIARALCQSVNLVAAELDAAFPPSTVTGAFFPVQTAVSHRSRNLEAEGVRTAREKTARAMTARAVRAVFPVEDERTEGNQENEHRISGSREDHGYAEKQDGGVENPRLHTGSFFQVQKQKNRHGHEATENVRVRQRGPHPEPPVEHLVLPVPERVGEEPVEALVY